MNHGVGWPFRLNRRHVARYALASGAAVFVMRVFFKSSSARPVGRQRAMAIQTKLVGWLSELRVISGAVSVVTIEACDSASVHHALHEIVSLHAVLVCGSIRIMKKIRGRAESMILELPIVPELPAHVVANRPIVILAFDRIRERLSLRMALDACIARRDVIHVRWISDIGARRIRGMFAARSVAALATYIPFGDLLGVDVVPDRMAAVAQRASRAVHIVQRIECSPPIASGRRHLVLAPLLVYDFPLDGQRKVVIAHLREETLFPNTAVNERNLVLGKLENVVGG